MDAPWPYGYCAGFQIEYSGFKSWLGSLCCVLGQDTLLLQGLSPLCCTNEYELINGGGNPSL